MHNNQGIYSEIESDQSVSDRRIPVTSTPSTTRPLASPTSWRNLSTVFANPYRCLDLGGPSREECCPRLLKVGLGVMFLGLFALTAAVSSAAFNRREHPNLLEVIAIDGGAFLTFSGMALIICAGVCQFRIMCLNWRDRDEAAASYIYMRSVGSIPN